MHKRRWLGFALPLLIAAAIWGMPDSEKRHRRDSSYLVDDDNNIDTSRAQSPIVTSTSLADTLAPEFIKILGIPDVAGTRIVAPYRTWSSYFIYSADKQKVFEALEQLPFTFTDDNVDLSVRPISFGDLHLIKTSLMPEEISTMSAFWIPNDDSRAYEFIKPPFRHTLIVSERTGNIQHRVEFAG
jgi:hypothetical protein